MKRRLQEPVRYILPGWLIGILFFLIFVLIGLAAWMNWQMESAPKQIILQVNMTVISPRFDVDDPGEITSLRNILENFAATHIYNLSTYNCVNYSNDVTDLLRAKGYGVRLIDGCNADNTSCHRWITIDIEPQWGMPVNHDADFPNQEVPVRVW